MVRSRKELPSPNEHVVATVKEIFDYGAYVELDEYNNMRAYLPWSEIASRWVRDIRDVISENQKIVVKVIRVQRHKKYVDVSLKRVYDNERKRKMLSFKRAQKAEKILEIAAEKLGKTLDDAYEQVGWPLEDYYGEIYAGLEQVAMRGEEALKEAGIPEEWWKPLMEVVSKQIRIKKVKIGGTATIRSYSSDGVKVVKKVLSTMMSAGNGVQVKVYTIGAPRYRVEVIADDYKTAEKVLSNLIKNAEKTARKEKAEFQFQREKS